MKILGLETALGACSVAVLDGERVLAHRWTLMERGHAEALAPMVQDVVAESKIAFADFDRLAVTSGPGTFTGQRVGLAFARGLRVALKKPLVGLTTLEVIAAAACAETGIDTIAVAHDARRGEVYLEIVADGASILAPIVLTAEDAVNAIAKHVQGGAIALAGTAAPQMADHLAALNIKVSLSTVRQPDALWVARLAQHRTPAAAAVAPLYLRAPDAKLPAQA
jgi:tRNA threonylcarbamoyladenosine biosynthesis protein TsaB